MAAEFANVILSDKQFATCMPFKAYMTVVVVVVVVLEGFCSLNPLNHRVTISTTYQNYKVVAMGLI
jgi:hypothetical protein